MKIEHFNGFGGGKKNVLESVFLLTIIRFLFIVDTMEQQIKRTVVPLSAKEQTGREMHRLIEGYYSDIDTLPLSRRGLVGAFNCIKKMPYRRDVPPIEVVSRPAVAVNMRGIDCKKKAILMSSYLRGRGIPYRLIASSRRPDGRAHHVFPQFQFGRYWMNCDATYPENEILDERYYTKTEELVR